MSEPTQDHRSEDSGQASLPQLHPNNSTTRYAFGELIARGGMGEVYRGTDTVLEREIAIKVLQPRFAPDSGTAQRFAEEARITGQLQHPNIPVVHDLGLLPDGRPYLAMKLIQGETLESLLKRYTDQDRGRLVAVFEQVCQAVGYGHSRGFVHRDLKPANIMVGAFGEVQVMDWGLAKSVGTPELLLPTKGNRPNDRIDATEDYTPQTPESTQAGTIMGTPKYMAPEQARGESHLAGPTADVYSLGLILWEVIWGKPLRSGPRATVIQQATQGELPTPLTPVEAELWQIMQRCLQLKTEERYPNAGALAEAVAAFRTGAENRARTAELERSRAEVRAAEQAKRRRVQGLLAGTLVLAVIGALAGLWWVDRQQREEHLRDQQRLAERTLEQQRSRDSLAASIARATNSLKSPNPVESVIRGELAEVQKRLTDDTLPEFREQFTQLEQSYAMLQRLDEVNRVRWEVLEANDTIDRQAAVRGYPLAFAAYGIVPVEPGSLSRVQQSLIRERLTAELEIWLGLDPQYPGLANLVNQLDPEPSRVQARAMVLAQDTEKLRSYLTKLDVNTTPAAHVLFLTARPTGIPLKSGDLLRLAAAARPDDFTLLVAAAAEINIGDIPKATQYTAAARALRPGNVYVNNSLCNLLRAGNRNPEALIVARQQVEQHPQSSTSHVNYALSLQLAYRLDEALEEHITAFRLNSALGVRAGTVFSLLRAHPQRKAVVKRLQTRAEQNPTSAIDLFFYALALSADDQREAVIKPCEEALRLNPNLTAAYYSLAKAYQFTNRPEDAIKAFFEGVNRRDNYNRTYTDLAQLLMKRQRALEALEVLDRGRDVREEWEADPQTRFQFTRACAYAMASLDATLPDDQAKYRKQAYFYLHRHHFVLNEMRKVPNGKFIADPQILNWGRDPDLKTIRSRWGKLDLPTEERTEWNELWESLDKLRKKVETDGN